MDEALDRGFQEIVDAINAANTPSGPEQQEELPDMDAELPDEAGGGEEDMGIDAPAGQGSSD